MLRECNERSYSIYFFSVMPVACEYLYVIVRIALLSILQTHRCLPVVSVLVNPEITRSRYS